MLSADRRWWWMVPIAALLCAALLGLGSGGAGARPVTARAAACGSGGSSTSFGVSQGGTRLVSELDVPVCVTGSLTVSFAGDPAAGCAAAGLCDYSGTETFTPGSGDTGDLNLTTTERAGHRSTSAFLTVGGLGSSVTSAVQRTVPGGTVACSDSGGSQTDLGGVFVTVPVHGARATIDLLHTSTPLLGSRCAGPLTVDVASALPARTVPLRELRHGETTIDLSGGGPFTAHGMSGTVASTLVLRLGRPERERETSPSRARGEHVRSLRTGTVRYRVARLTGDAVATVQSSTVPAACGPLDACGLGGTITLTPGASARGAAFVTALNSRAAVGVLRAELRGRGPASATLDGGGTADVRGSVTAALTQDGGACADGVSLRQFTIGLARHGRWLEVTLAPSDSQAADPLRTRCPGPEIGSAKLAAARLPATVLARPAFTATLRGRAFTDGPYRVSIRSTLALTLRRGVTRVRAIRIVSVSPSAGASSGNGGGFTRAG